MTEREREEERERERVYVLVCERDREGVSVCVLLCVCVLERERGGYNLIIDSFVLRVPATGNRIRFRPFPSSEHILRTFVSGSNQNNIGNFVCVLKNEKTYFLWIIKV